MKKVLDHGEINLINISGPVRRLNKKFDADVIDPAQTARMSFGKMQSKRKRSDDIRLVKYLINNKHTTPIEMIECWITMTMPIFVARQFVRHRTVSINEISARYVSLPERWYIPEREVIGIQPGNIKQGRVFEDNESAEWFQKELNNSCEEDYISYLTAVERGIPKELARSFLHVNHYTQWIWKQDLHNLLHFLKLRLDGHAQYESRMYAGAIRDELVEALPELLDIIPWLRGGEL